MNASGYTATENRTDELTIMPAAFFRGTYYFAIVKLAPAVDPLKVSGGHE